MSVRRALLPALTSLLLLLTGCGAGQSTADPPLPPPTSSATSQAPKPETPEHFIRRWAAEEARMENTGDTKAYLAISGDCQPCRRVVRTVRRFYAVGGFVKWGGWTFLSIVRAGTSGRYVTFAARIDSAATDYKESAGTPTKHLQGGRSTELLTLELTGSGWVMHDTAERAS